MHTVRTSAKRIRRRCVDGAFGACVMLWLACQPSPARAAQPADAITPLAGTVVGEGSHTQALFGAGDHFAWVKVGQPVAEGFRLIDVRADGVTVKEEGTDREIQILLWDDGSSTNRSPSPTSRRAKPVPRATRPEKRVLDVRSMTPRELDRLTDDIKAKFERARAEDAARRGEEGNRSGGPE